jgi:hypothetical protein
MDQFDELIKEKAEKKVFKYKPLFWILFAKSAGISAFSAVQIISTVLIVGGLAGGGTYLGIHSYHKSKNKKATRQVEQIQPQQDPIIASDTLRIESVSSQPEIEKPVDKHHATTPKSSPQVVSEPTNPVITTKRDTVSKKQTNRNPYDGMRILTINPDTIKSNY